MAQAEEAEEVVDDENEHEEAEELEQLLANTDNEDAEGVDGGEQASEAGDPPKGKKTWLLIGAGTLLLFLLAGGAYFFLFSSEPDPEGEPKPGEQAGEEVPTPAPVETVKSTFNKVHIFTLEPFFLPLKKNGKETGSFISVVPNLVLSNETLRKEIENSLPSIRRNIYNVLSRKDPQQYYSTKRKIEEQIKKEILVTVNPILLAGTGTVTDVVFTQFVVK